MTSKTAARHALALQLLYIYTGAFLPPPLHVKPIDKGEMLGSSCTRSQSFAEVTLVAYIEL
jgi:hypothetical protein